MTDTRQLRILKGLTAHLEGVTPINGYDFDLTGRVYRGKARFGAEEPVPFVSILESMRPDPRPMEAGNERLNREERWELLIQGWLKENREYPTDDLYLLKGAVEKRLSEIVAVDGQGNPVSPRHVYRLGGLIAGLRIGPGVVRAATPQVGGTEAFYLPILVIYVINLADPYA